MGSRGRLVAIDDVLIQSHPDHFESMLWFYRDLIGLKAVGNVGHGNDRPDELVFRSDQHDLRVDFREDAAIESIDVRVMCEVPSLEDVAEQLIERKIEHDWLHGLARTDRRIQLLDPAGNRVELRKLWPQRTV